MFDFRYLEDVLLFFSSDQRVGRNVVLDHEAWVHGREIETRYIIVQSNLRLEDDRSLVGDDGLFHPGGDELAEFVGLHHEIVVDPEPYGRGYHLVRRQSGEC